MTNSPQSRSAPATDFSDRGSTPGRGAASLHRNKPWFAYLLECRDGTIYAGATVDVRRRLIAHASGDVRYTRGRLPVRLVWSKECKNQSAALAEERRVKRLSRARKLALIEATP